MRFRKLEKWDNVADSAALIYFAQLVEELLFVFSLDTYRPSAMNSALLCREAQTVADDVDKNIIASPNFQHVLDELYDTLRCDVVAQALLPNDLDSIFSVLKNPKESFNSKKVVSELLTIQLALKKYRVTTEQLLCEAIKDGKNDFSKIRSLARTYITTLVNMGYNTNFMYRKVVDFFYHGSNRISGNEAIEDFLSLFKDKKRKFGVLFRGGDIFRNIKESCEKFGIKVLLSADELEFGIPQNFSLRKSEVYVFVEVAQEHDQYSAFNKARRRLHDISSIYTIFHHKTQPAFTDDGIVFDLDTTDYHRLRKSLNDMVRCIDTPPEKASEELVTFLQEFSLKTTSLKKFIRTVELHSLALQSDSLENQMINLWIALESIIPPQGTDKSSAKIDHMATSLIPFLSLSYIEQLVERFMSDISRWNRPAFVRHIRLLSDETDKVNMVKLLALPELKKNREDFQKEFRNYHLLQDRFDFFVKSFENPEGIFNLLSRHSQRVQWQLRRIYRARNMIVHDGRTPSYTNILITNTHAYLDIILDTISILASRPKAVLSIEQAFTYVELLDDSRTRWLKKKGATFDCNNLKRLVGDVLSVNDDC